MWSTFFCICKIDGDINHLKIFVHRFFGTWKNFLISLSILKMVDHILEIPRLVVFGVNVILQNIFKK